MRSVWHAPQQICTGCGSCLPQPVGVKSPVSGDQHARLEVGDEFFGEDALVHAPGSQPGSDHSVCPAFPKSNDFHLRERGGVLLPSGASELRVIRWSIGNVQHEPVDGHQPPSAQPGSLCAPLSARQRHPLEQHPQRLRSQTPTCLRNCACRGDRPVLPPCPKKPQAVDEQTEYFLVRLTEEQAQTHDVVDDNACWQQSGPLLGPSCPGELNRPGFGRDLRLWLWPGVSWIPRSGWPRTRRAERGLSHRGGAGGCTSRSTRRWPTRLGRATSRGAGV